MEDNQQSQRIQTSLLNKAERRLLIWMAERMPRRVTSDMLTMVGSFGALLICAGYALTTLDYRWLWLASAGFVVNWLGDSLDGSLARVRNEQRPIYGFFLDHNIDGINETLMFVGLGLSPFIHFGLAMLILVVYLLLSCYVYINAHLKNEFKLTYAKMGPTEFRLLAIIMNKILVFAPALRSYNATWTLAGRSIDMGLLDIAGLIVLVILIAMHWASLIHDGRAFARLDPPKRKRQ